MGIEVNHLVQLIFGAFWGVLLSAFIRELIWVFFKIRFFKHFHPLCREKISIMVIFIRKIYIIVLV